MAFTLSSFVEYLQKLRTLNDDSMEDSSLWLSILDVLSNSFSYDDGGKS